TANPRVCDAAVRRAALRAGRGAAVSRGTAGTAAAGTAAAGNGSAATVTAIVTADDPQTQERSHEGKPERHRRGPEHLPGGLPALGVPADLNLRPASVRRRQCLLR